MKRRVFVLPAAVALVLSALTPAAARQQRQTTGRPLSVYALLYAGDPNLRKELNLTDEQVKKIDELRNTIGANGLLGFGGSGAAETTATVDKAFAEILEPGQVKRLRQVVMQHLARGSARSGTAVLALANMPEVEKELKLTDEQKAKIGPGVKLTDVLTDQQKKAWRDLTGEPFETALQATLPGAGTGAFGSRVTPPPALLYLVQKPVADDLKLSEAQTKKVAELQERWRKEAPTTTRTAEDRNKVEALKAATEREAAEALDAAQNRRLGQILLRQSLPAGREADVFTTPRVVAELKLSDAQNAKLKAIHEERRQAMAALFLGGDSAAEIARKVEAHKKETYALLLAVLDRDQQRQLDDLLGEPVRGTVTRPGAFGPVGTGGPAASVAAPTAPVYLSITGVLYVDNKALQEELKLTEDQAKRLTELRDRSRARTTAIRNEARDTDDREKMRAEQARDNEKALAEILEPKQLARLKQVTLQYLASTGARGSPSLGRVGEVAEGLHLTRDQQDRLQQGAAFASVLDERQQAKWKEMLGAPFANAATLNQRLTPGGQGGGRGTGGPGTVFAPVQLNYLAAKDVQADLKLTDEQIKKLPELTQKWEELTRDLPAARAERTAKLNEAREALDRAIAGVLDGKQAARLHQIELQQTRKRGLGALLTGAGVQKELELSEEQVKKIADIRADAASTEALMSRELALAADSRRGAPDETYGKTVQEFNRSTDTKLNAVLTPKQADRLTAMLGEPFTGEVRPAVPDRGPTRPRTPSPSGSSGITTSARGAAGPGVLISRVTPDSPGAKAGLRAGDRIVEVAGQPLTGRPQWLNLLANFKPGEKVEIVVERNGQKEKVTYVGE